MKWSGRVDSNHRPLGPEPTEQLNFSEENRRIFGSGNCRVTLQTEAPPITVDNRISSAELLPVLDLETGHASKLA
jgi:hypothetical protein